MQYLVTPKFVLGSDSFYIEAPDLTKAVEIARAKIISEEWSGDWEIYEHKLDFECSADGDY